MLGERNKVILRERSKDFFESVDAIKELDKPLSTHEDKLLGVRFSSSLLMQ